MCTCNTSKLCSICSGRLAVYKFMVEEWEKTNPRPKGISIDDMQCWQRARMNAMQEYQRRTGIFKV